MNDKIKETADIGALLTILEHERAARIEDKSRLELLRNMYRSLCFVAVSDKLQKPDKEWAEAMIKTVDDWLNNESIDPHNVTKAMVDVRKIMNDLERKDLDEFAEAIGDKVYDPPKGAVKYWIRENCMKQIADTCVRLRRYGTAFKYYKKQQTYSVKGWGLVIDAYPELIPFRLTFSWPKQKIMIVGDIHEGSQDQRLHIAPKKVKEALEKDAEN